MSSTTERQLRVPLPPHRKLFLGQQCLLCFFRVETSLQSCENFSTNGQYTSHVMIFFFYLTLVFSTHCTHVNLQHFTLAMWLLALFLSFVFNIAINAVSRQLGRDSLILCTLALLILIKPALYKHRTRLEAIHATFSGRMILRSYKMESTSSVLRVAPHEVSFFSFCIMSRACCFMALP